MSFGDKPKKQYKQRPKFERQPVGGEHQIDPVFEAIISQSDKLLPFNVSGNSLSHDIVSFDLPGGDRLSIEAYKAMMVTNMTFCVPFDNPAYPEIMKLNTQADRAFHFAAYRARIFWKHSGDFWHIPGFTRYVINKHGHIKNAYNGMDIKPNNWGQYALFNDMVGVFENKPPFPNIDINRLKMLSFKLLPSDFVDYGFGTYNYELGYSVESKTIDWVKRPQVVIRDGMGNVEEAANLTEFGIVYLNSKSMKELREIKEASLYSGNQSAGQFTVKLKNDALVSQVPVVNISGQGNATTPEVQNYSDNAQATQTATTQAAPDNSGNVTVKNISFDDEIGF